MDGVFVPEIEMSDATDPQPPKNRKPFLLTVAAFLVLVVGMAAGALLGPLLLGHEAGGKPVPAGMSAYEPGNAEERELFKHLRKATFSEGVAMGRATNDVGLAGSWDVYVATDHVVLPSKPLGQAITIGLPKGIVWVDGPLTNVRLVATSGNIDSLPLALSVGLVIYDRMCQSTQADSLADNLCQAPPQAITAQAMAKSLRPLDPKEFKSYPGLEHVDSAVPLRQGNVFLASGTVVLSPYLGDTKGVPVIVLDEGAQIVGGDFGKIQVVGADVSQTRRPDYEILHDPVYTAALSDTWRQQLCDHMSQPVKQGNYPGVCN